MAALSANAALTKRNAHAKTKHTFVVTTNSVVYQDALMAHSTSTNKCMPATDAATTRYFAGIALETQASGGFPVTGDGTKTVDCYRFLEVKIPAVTALTKGKIFQAIYAFDDANITAVTTKGPEIGFMSEFVTLNTEVWVFLGVKALGAAS